MTQMYPLDFVVRAYIKQPPQQIWKGMPDKRHEHAIAYAASSSIFIDDDTLLAFAN